MTDSTLAPTPPLSPEDDTFHPPAGGHWAAETVLFSFYAPERDLGGWVYTIFRPAIGTMGGGVWVWDATATLPWEVPYHAVYSSLSLPAGADLRDCVLPNGVHLQVLDPLQRYRLRYDDADLIAFDLEFAGTSPPHDMFVGDPPARVHYEQPGHVTGQLLLHGTDIPIDCVAMRDRTWTVRPETGAMRVCYSWAIGEPGNGFLLMGVPAPDGTILGRGYLERDGVRTPIASATRHDERDPEGSFINKTTITATDTDGRTVEAQGTVRSRMATPLPAVARMLMWVSLIEWSIEGETMWGEDQDCWPYPQWSALGRT